MASAAASLTWAAWVRRSRRRAHLGGRSSEGTTQAILARRQLEHGEALSQRTFRRRQMRQLRSLGLGAETDADADAGALVTVAPTDVACFSDTEAEPSEIFASGLPLDAPRMGVAMERHSEHSGICRIDLGGLLALGFTLTSVNGFLGPGIMHFNSLDIATAYSGALFLKPFRTVSRVGKRDTQTGIVAWGGLEG